MCKTYNYLKLKSKIDLLRGIPPGKIIERDLLKKNISQRSLAAAIHEHFQTLNAVISGRRKLTTSLALKIESELGYPEGFLLTLQAYYDIAVYKQTPKELNNDIPAIRPILFWDTKFDTIDWHKHKKAVIGRVLERGSRQEMEEIAHFYALSIDELQQFRYRNTYRIRSATKIKK
jgi:antitoxin HigA-1